MAFAGLHWIFQLIVQLIIDLNQLGSDHAPSFPIHLQAHKVAQSHTKVNPEYLYPSDQEIKSIFLVGSFYFLYFNLPSTCRFASDLHLIFHRQWQYFWTIDGSCRLFWSMLANFLYYLSLLILFRFDLIAILGVANWNLSAFPLQNECVHGQTNRTVHITHCWMASLWLIVWSESTPPHSHMPTLPSLTQHLTNPFRLHSTNRVENGNSFDNPTE